MAKKKKRSERAPNEQVHVLVNPVVYVRSGKNLTGISRLVCEVAQDMWTTTQRWNSELLSGTAVISQLRITLFSKLKNDVDLSIQQRNEIMRLNTDLGRICDNMESLVTALKCQCYKLYNIQALDKFRSGCRPIFSTWSTSKFIDTSRLLHEMYVNELRLKFAIKEELAFCNCDRNLIAFYATAWLHQPYFEESISSSFSAMMNEVGHNVL